MSSVNNLLQNQPQLITGSPSGDDGINNDDSMSGSGKTQRSGDVDGSQYVVGTGIPQQQLYTTGASSTSNEDVPLPDVTGASNTNGAAAEQTPKWLQQGKPMSLAQAVSMLSDIESDQMIQYGRMKNLYGNNEVSMQKDSAQQTINQVQGERESAVTKLAGSIFASAASFGLGMKGGSMQMQKGKEAMGAATFALSQSVSQLINNATDTIDKLAGGGYKADQAKIQKSIDDIYVSMYKTQQDNFNNGYEDKRKNLQSVFDMMRQVADGNNQTIMNVANNA